MLEFEKICLNIKDPLEKKKKSVLNGETIVKFKSQIVY